MRFTHPTCRIIADAETSRDCRLAGRGHRRGAGDGQRGISHPAAVRGADAVVDEMERLDKAIAAAAAEIAHHRETVSAELGEKYGAIFEAHLQMLQDSRLRGELEEMIRQRHYSPEYAVSRTLRRYAQVFQRLESSYLAERANDIFDIEKRLLRHLLGAAAKALPTSPRRCWYWPQPDAQRDGQSRSPLRPRVCDRDRRAGQPYGNRGRGPRDSGRRGHRTVFDGSFRRRPGHYRRRQGVGDPPAGRGVVGPLSPRGRGVTLHKRPSSSRSAICPPKPATASASNCWATSSSPMR